MAGKKPSKARPPQICPICGADVPPQSLACPECGADHDSGWRPDADFQQADLPDDDAFDYDEYLAKEFGASPKPEGIRTIWWVTAIVLLLAAAWTVTLYLRGLS